MEANGARPLVFRNNSATRMIIEVSGRMGLGTASPSTTLHLSGSADTYLTLQAGTTDGNDGILFKNSAGTQKGAFLYDTDDNYLLFNVNESERMRIDSGGNVAIGGDTITDSNLLNIQGNGAAKNIGIVLNDTNTSRIYGIQNGSSVFKIFDYTASAERMRIDSSGHLQIGSSTSDSFRLKVLNGAGTLARFTDGTSQTLDIRQATGGIELQNPNNGFISFKGSSAERMRIDSSGRLLVGITQSFANANADNLQVGGSAAVESWIVYSSTIGSGIRFGTMLATPV